MKVNVSKFQSIVFTTKGVTNDMELCFSDQVIQSVSCVRLLGVKIDNRLSFDDHVSSICSKVSLQISALRRIVKFLSLENRISIYNAFIASNFTYCNTVWHFCSNRSLFKLEKIHKQALRVVLNDHTSSYLGLLEQMQRPSLYVTRLKCIATEAYKCYKDENPAYINDMLYRSKQPYDLRAGPLAEQPKVSSTYSGLNSFCYQAAKLWNILPSKIKTAASLSEFKTLLSHWPGPTCHCGSCVLCRMYNV